MKKLIALLLAVFMLLSGCAAGTTTIKEEKALSELGESKREESMAVVNVTINPEFELYLDIDFNVTKVRCLNEDAVTTLEAVQTDLVGNNYGAAMFSILDAATQAGFLAPDAQVKIETTLHTPMAEQDLEYMAQSMANPVKVFSENNGLSLAVESVTPTVDEKAVEAFMKAYEDQIANQPSGNQSAGHQSDKLSGSYTGNIIDEKGNRIGTAEYYYDENGNLLNQTLNFDDGTSSYSAYEYDANGTLIKEESVHSDGSSNVYTYFPNGSIETSLWIASDGYTVTETYYESGTLKSSISDYDGNHSEYHYAEDGTLIDEVIETRPWNMGEPNSVQEVQVYNDHGEGTSTWYFNENGYLYKAVDVYPDGATYEITYYENGNQKSVLDLSPYGSSYMYYNEDGTMAPNRGEPNSVIELGNETKYYDENGALYKEVLVRQDGSVMETTYYPNGNRKSVYDNDPNNPGYWFFEEDGSEKPFNKGEPNLIAPITCYSPDDQKGINTRYFDEEGLLYKEIQEYPDGTSLEIGYSKGGNQTYSISEGPDGHIEWHYNLTVQGQLTKYIADTAEEYYEVHYYQNGKMSLQISWDKETGYYYEAHYNQDGNIISEHSETR